MVAEDPDVWLVDVEALLHAVRREVADEQVEEPLSRDLRAFMAGDNPWAHFPVGADACVPFFDAHLLVGKPVDPFWPIIFLVCGIRSPHGEQAQVREIREIPAGMRSVQVGHVVVVAEDDLVQCSIHVSEMPVMLCLQAEVAEDERRPVCLRDDPQVVIQVLVHVPDEEHEGRERCLAIKRFMVALDNCMKKHWGKKEMISHDPCYVSRRLKGRERRGIKSQGF
jgi:hypothetical protein